ncbi:HNH endonuclease [Phascolarctobacterium faecium]|jgi:hypothetical protein|uniref:HNH endonuclease n=2 Tax=Phascolarctobacterium faecium TaxID=33025 RepID=UPI0026708801|nr:HNH endonuclease signature motif containing protein [Phascolarctobacterium faecium]
MTSVHHMKPVRSKPTKTFNDHKKYKSQLEKDFYKCCGYCDDHHGFSGGSKFFHVDHFAPKSKFKNEYSAYINDYNNLVYSCPYCNRHKSNKWLGKAPFEYVVNNKGFIDPCADEYDDHLFRNEDGSIGYSENDDIGRYMYEELFLFLKRHQICYIMYQLNNKLEQLDELIEKKEQCGGEIPNDIHETFYMALRRFRKYFGKYILEGEDM